MADATQRKVARQWYINCNAIGLVWKKFLTFWQKNNFTQWRHQSWARRLNPPNMSLSPSPPWNILVKNQEANCAKYWNFDRFCSQNLYTMSAMLPLLGDFVPPIPYRGFARIAPGLHLALPSPNSLGYGPQMKILAPPLVLLRYKPYYKPH